MDRVAEIKRAHGVAAIRLESGETLRAPSAVYLESPLRPGQPLDADAYRAFVNKVSDGHALEAAMKYLALRERSVREVKARLRRACYGEETVERVVAALEKHHLLSDARMADAWTASRSRKYGRNRVARELRQKGIPDEEVSRALETIPQEDEFRRALDQARKLLRKFGGDRQKTVSALIRRGYPWPLARRAAEQAGEDDA